MQPGPEDPLREQRELRALKNLAARQGWSIQDDGMRAECPYHSRKDSRMDKIAEVARDLAHHISRRRRSRLEDVAALCEDLASVGNAVLTLKRVELSQAATGPYLKVLRDHLESVAVGAMELLLALGVTDFKDAFVEEYEKATKKHPGMTLDSDNHTDETRFYALAEEVGEVCAALTYDNAAQTGHNANLIGEVTQVGGLALAWLLRYQEDER